MPRISKDKQAQNERLLRHQKEIEELEKLMGGTTPGGKRFIGKRLLIVRYLRAPDSVEIAIPEVDVNAANQR